MIEIGRLEQVVCFLNSKHLNLIKIVHLVKIGKKKFKFFKLILQNITTDSYLFNKNWKLKF